MSTTYNVTQSNLLLPSLLDIFKIFDICKKVSWRLSRCEQCLFLLEVPKTAQGQSVEMARKI